MRLFKKLLSVSSTVFLLVSIFMGVPLIVKAEGTVQGAFAITKSSIANNQTDVPRALKITFEASEILDSSVDYSSMVSLKDDSNGATDIYASIHVDTKVFDIYVTEYLKPETNYTLTFQKGAFKDKNGNAFAEDYVLKFKTRKDNVMKIGPHGDYSNFEESAVLFNTNQRQTTDGLKVKVEHGTYNVPAIRLANSNVSIEGGYNDTFTSQGSKDGTVLECTSERTFDITIYDNYRDDTEIKFGFHNLTFTKDGRTNEGNSEMSNMPIFINCEQKYIIDVDISNCIFAMLEGNMSPRQTLGEEEVYPAAPVTSIMERRCTLNLNISTSEFLNNEYEGMSSPSGGVFSISGGEATTNLKVTNSIFAYNTGFVSGAIIAGCTESGKLNQVFYNNTIVRNESIINREELPEYGLSAAAGGIFIISSDSSANIKGDFKNNIVWGNNDSEGPNDIMLYAEKYGETDGACITCNLDSNNIGKIDKKGDGKSVGNLPIEFTNINCLNVDPQFAGRDDFRLLSTSPMIDKGVNVDLTKDIAGNKRPQGAAFDLGAYEASTTAPALATFSFSVSSMEVSEAAGKAVVTVKRTGNSAGKVTVDYNTMDGTAKAGSDYTAASGKLAFEDGETTKSFEVAVANDTEVEQGEAFTAALSNPSEGAQLGEPKVFTINIKDDDKAPVLVQTGSMMDMSVLMAAGIVLISAGAFLYIRRKRIS